MIIELKNPTKRNVNQMNDLFWNSIEYQFNLLSDSEKRLVIANHFDDRPVWSDDQLEYNSLSPNKKLSSHLHKQILFYNTTQLEAEYDFWKNDKFDFYKGVPTLNNIPKNEIKDVSEFKKYWNRDNYVFAKNIGQFILFEKIFRLPDFLLKGIFNFLYLLSKEDRLNELSLIDGIDSIFTRNLTFQVDDNIVLTNSEIIPTVVSIMSSDCFEKEWFVEYPKRYPNKINEFKSNLIDEPAYSIEVGDVIIKKGFVSKGIIVKNKK